MRGNKHYSILTLLVVFFSVLVFARTATAAPIEGFRGIRWGEPLSKYKAVMIPSGLESSPPSECYFRADDHPTFAGVYVGPIGYEFDEKGFWSAGFSIDYGFKPKTKDDHLKSSKSMSEFENKVNKILAASKKQWGPPIKEVSPMLEEEELTEYTWVTKETIGRLSFMTNSPEAKLNKKKPYGIFIFLVESIDGIARKEERQKQRKSDF